jgi:quinolinate synthase
LEGRNTTLDDRIKQEIEVLKRDRNAVVLAHLYTHPEVQDLADIVGDSLDLSRKAMEAKADVIVFCGVRFMAETAKILNPGRTVLLPEPDAGCPMADMVTAEDLARLRSEYPDAAFMCYVNSSAEVKAACDICCTSTNAVAVAQSLAEPQIVFVPDQNLGHYISRFVPEKQVILFSGFCPIHHSMAPEDVAEARAQHPGAPVLAHPECPPAVLDQADFVGSTMRIITFAGKSDAKEFIIGTEPGVLYRMQNLNPEKHFYPLRIASRCANMKKTTPENLLDALLRMQVPVELDARIIEEASGSLKRMFAV